MGQLSKEKLLEFMTKRMKSLEEQHIRDFNGGLQHRIFEYREVKWWKEAIERGEFDSESVPKNLVQK